MMRACVTVWARGASCGETTRVSDDDVGPAELMIVGTILTVRWVTSIPTLGASCTSPGPNMELARSDWPSAEGLNALTVGDMVAVPRRDARRQFKTARM